MMEIVTVWLLYTVTILIKYRHYFVEENLLVNTLLFPYHL